MSGWMIMGLPGCDSTGLSAMWITIALALTLGAYINYFVVAPYTSCLYRISWRCNYITRFL